MKTGLFAAGVMTGLVGLTAAAYAMKQTMPGTDMGRTVSRAAHTAAGTVSNMAHDAADAVDHVVR